MGSEMCIRDSVPEADRVPKANLVPEAMNKTDAVNFGFSILPVLFDPV